MASPYITSSHRPQAERNWFGIAVLAGVPLLSLVLIRMLWSGSSLWFLTVGIILLGAAAIVFLARRTQEHEYSRQTLAPETTRAPLILMGLGVLFLAMLVLPNFSGGDSSSDRLSQLREQTAAGSQTSQVAGAEEEPASALPSSQTSSSQQSSSQQTTQQSTLPEPAAPAGETYIVQDGDTLWDIALEFGTTVEAIIAANALADPEDLSIGQELIIPPAGAESTTGLPATEDDTEAGTGADDGTGDASVP